MKKQIATTTFILFIIQFAVFGQQAAFTDYCEYLSKEVQGKQHGFMAGNNTYYIGGFTPIWKQQEDETIGLTHPFFNDLRCRGTSMVEYTTNDGWDTGYGHDISGWEFYKDVRCAYGTIKVDGKEYVNPSPTRMYWQPDKMICEYDFDEVTVREEKFIAANDVVSTVITSSKPIILEFTGRSFVTKTSGRKMYTTTAAGSYDAQTNAIRVDEGGTIQAQPEYGNFKDGILMYSGMSNVISTSVPMENVEFWFTTEQSKEWTFVENVVNYKFEVACDTDGVTLSWLIGDDYDETLAKVQAVVADAQTHMEAKTAKINSQLNDQIPYFRCSDDDVVKVYYYLNAINLMYYTFKDEGQLKYAHTQSAVNNYLGNHAFDNIFQSRVGSWYLDKEYYAYGNILIWSSLLKEYNGKKDYVNSLRSLPDNIGTTWNSGIDGGPNAVAHIPQALQIYEHSGDIDFLAKAYEYYSTLYPTKFYGWHWGFGFNAGPDMQKMAQILGKPEEEANKWIGPGYSNNAWVEQPGGFLDTEWGINEPTLFGRTTKMNGETFYAWSHFAYGNMDQFRRENLITMTNEWLMDSVKGYNHPLCNPTFGAMKMWDLVPNDFASAPDIAWYSYRPLFKHHLCEEGIYLTLKHIKQYNMEWGMPVAPEARWKSPWPGLWGDQYSNFNAGKIDLLIEGIGGLQYSFIDNSFTYEGHLPKEWDFMEWRVPVKHHDWDKEVWVVARSEREICGNEITIKATVKSNPMENLHLTPWHEGKEIKEVMPATSAIVNYNHIGTTFTNQQDAEVIFTLIDSEITDPCVIQQTIELKEGWNLVSLNVNLVNPSVPEIFSNATVVKTLDAFFHSGNELFLNSLTEIEGGKGYLVYNKIDETVTIEGIPVDMPHITSLLSGWNLIGVPTKGNFDISKLPLGTEIVKDFETFYEKDNQLNSLDELKPGKGYFIKVNNNSSINW